MTGCLRLAHPIYWRHGITDVEAEYEKGMLKPSTPLTLRPGERVHLIVMRQPDPKRWDLSRLAQSRAGR